MRAFFLFLFFSANLWAQDINVPPLTSPVEDLAGLFSPQEKADLSDLAYEIHTHQGPQITVLTVPDLQGLPIEDFSIKVAEKWQLGTKDKGNGLLILISKAERKVRIEVGQGIEGEITDYHTSLYTRDIFPRHFKEGDFHGGVRAFMQDVAGKFNIKTGEAGNKYVSPAPPRLATPLGGFLPFVAIGLVLLFSLFGRRFRLGRGIVNAIFFGFLGFVMGNIFLAVIASLFGFMIGLASPGRSYRRGGGWYGGGGGFGGGGFGGGGGGWSGGGGGFSGGGSSGSW